MASLVSKRRLLLFNPIGATTDNNRLNRTVAPDNALHCCRPASVTVLAAATAAP